MSISFEQLKEEAAKLSESERAELAALLIESLDPPEAGATPEEIEQAWLREIERRSAQIDRGETEMIDPDVAIARLRQRLGQHLSQR